MKHIALLAAFILLSFTFNASAQTIALHPTVLKDMPSGEYKIDPTHVSLIWKVNHLGLSHYTARFTKIDGTLVFDPIDPTHSHVTVTVNPTSVKTDYPDPQKTDFDKQIAYSEQWLNAGKFPEIKFVSKKIEKISDTKGKIHGELTFMGVTKPLTLDTTYNGAYAKMPIIEKAAIGFSATTTLKRSDWGFNGSIPIIGDDVQLLIEVEFDKLPVSK
jgi:polyisoprenoid-binding protein YceI